MLIDKALQPRPEDVVIACLNGDPLIKIFDIEQQQVVLRSANPAYPSRYVLEGEELHIWGVYIDLCRQGRNCG